MNPRVTGPEKGLRAGQTDTPHTYEVKEALSTKLLARGQRGHRPPDSRVLVNIGGAATPDVDTALHSLQSGFGHIGRKVVKLL